MDVITGFIIIEALLVIAAVVAYEAIRFISHSLNDIHPVPADENDTIPISMDSSSLSLDIIDAPAPPPAIKHDVFLSFRGKDTRDSFTSHLHKALCKAKIQTFIDDRLKKGEGISLALMRTTEESKISVIIFSNNYASSTWCLDELVKILECKQKYGRVVIPIFYNVDPSNIRKQSGSYRDAFIKHEQRFKSNKLKVQRWKDALTLAANLSGWDSMKLRPESRLIAEIVKDILKKINRASSLDFEGLVGIHPHIENIEALLCLKLPEVRMLGIWGMGGIGKTTIAQIVFDKLNSQFESCCFVAKVQEHIARIGLSKIQNECLSKLLNDEDFSTCSINSNYVKNRLQDKKILLVLDDVDNCLQVEDLIKMCACFGLGSRIIITSRDLQVLKTAGAYRTYHVQEMNFHDALELFSLSAFKQHEPEKKFVELSEQGVKYCQGVPLALKVMGSFLYGRTKDAWESAFQKFKKAPSLEIFYVLKLSFDGLDEEQKYIFLDLACFWRAKKPFLRQMQYYYDLSVCIEIDVLIDRSLISIDEEEQIVMHDLVRAMGQEVDRQQSRNQLGKPIRLWQSGDIYHIFKSKMGAEVERIRSISLDMSKIKMVELTTATFEKMRNIKFLEFFTTDSWEPSKVYIVESIEYLPEELKIFFWEKCPLPSIPLRFCAENLVEFLMPLNNLQHLWDGDLHFPNLKEIDVSESRHLTTLPDLSQAPNVQNINLLFCTNLVQVHSSNSLANLRHFSSYGCNKLRCVNLCSNIPPTSSKLLFVNHYFSTRYLSFLEVSVKALISQDGKICGFHVKQEWVPFEGIYDIGSEELKCLASFLPFVDSVCWLDFPLSVEIGGQHLETLVAYDRDPQTREGHLFCLVFPDIYEKANSSKHPSIKGTTTITTKEVVQCLDEWMGPENLVVDCDEGYYGYNGLSKIYNIARWSLLTRLSLQRNKTVRSCNSTLKSLQSKYELTLSLSSGWPSSNLCTCYLAGTVMESIGQLYRVCITVFSRHIVFDVN